MPRVLRSALCALLAVAAAFALDRWAFTNLTLEGVYDKDWGRFFRIIGYYPVWVIAALALWLHERGIVAAAKRRAILLFASPAVAGLAAEILKITLRRERPATHDGEYVFRSFSERPLSSGGLALPSSHTMVAFGAAAMLAYLFPRARWVWFALAAACGLTRVLAQAHFLSDVVVAALAALATTAWLWRKYGGVTAAAAAP